MKLNSQELKKIFNDSNNDKEYDVLIYSSFNLFQVKNVKISGNKVIIFAGDADNPTDIETPDHYEPEIA